MAKKKQDRPSGGYTEVARHLERERNVKVSRQLVWMWWSRRAVIGFPQGWVHLTPNHGTVRRFYLDEVLAWFDHTDRSVTKADAVSSSASTDGGSVT